MVDHINAKTIGPEDSVSHTAVSRTDQQMMAHGRQAEALRLARLSLAQRFGDLEQPVSLMLERLDLSALEALIVDPPLMLDEVRQRVGLAQAAAVSAHAENQRARPPQRLSPLGGYRHTN